MTISGVSAPRGASPSWVEAFEQVRAPGADAPLTEISPAAPGDEAVALGFTLGWARMAVRDGLLFWAAPEASLAETGVPHAQGLAQFGVALERLLIARTRSQLDALWAAEQALAIANACVICTIAPSSSALSLTATRRLLLLAEKNRSRCVLLRFDRLSASAAWTRWRIASARSHGIARELGAPSFTAHLIRNRAGSLQREAAGASWRLEWNAHDYAFVAGAPALDGVVATVPGDGSAEARRRRAG